MDRAKHAEMNLTGGLAAIREMFAYTRSDEESDPVVRCLLKGCLALFHADGAALFLGGRPLTKYYLTRYRSERSLTKVGRTVLPDPGRLVDRALKEARPFVHSLSADEASFDAGRFDAGRDGIPGITDPRQLLVAPLESTPPAIGCIVLAFEEALQDAQFILADLAQMASVGLQALEQQSSFERLRRLSTTDDLTGAYNYRYLLDSVRREIKRASRFQQVFSFLMVDVDHLKEYNDVHGHLAGSQLLTAFSGIVQAQLRAVDTLAKYGGDEFGVILPQTDKGGAKIVAERIRSAVESHRFAGEVRKITASVGVSSYPDDGEDVESLLGHSDKALYRAKNKGRNRICVVGED